MNSQRKTTKDEIRESAGWKCQRCGMTYDEHFLRTGRGLNAHRMTPGSEDTIEGCEVLCMWCHAKEHKKNGRLVYRKYFPPQYAMHREDVRLALQYEEAARLRALSRSLGLSAEDVVYAGLALLQLEYEKKSGRELDT